MKFTTLSAVIAIVALSGYTTGPLPVSMTSKMKHKGDAITVEWAEKQTCSAEVKGKTVVWTQSASRVCSL